MLKGTLSVIEKAAAVISERIIRMADDSEYGRDTVAEYEDDEIGKILMIKRSCLRQ